MLTIDFAGERHAIDTGPFVIGREGDLRVDDNPYLHRRFLEIRSEHGLWWLLNVGSLNTATVSDGSSGVHAWLPPGGRMPIVFGLTRVQFGAGPTNYEIELLLDDAPYEFDLTSATEDGTTTIGRLPLTVDQRRMLVALAEHALRRGTPGIAEIPTAAVAARRLGWTQKKFEKKVDNVCERLAGMGVRGLKGDQSSLAMSRRARLVQYGIATRLVTAADLALLDRVSAGADDDEDDQQA